jgi:glycosyltransferase involved in cell wall biosynthesis
MTNDQPLVLHVRGVTGVGGGPEKTILNSPRFLRSLGYEASCAYMHPPGDPGFEKLRQRAERAAAPIISVPDRGALDWRVLTQLIRICRREKPAIWHGHDYKSNVLGLVVRRFWPMKLVTTVHGWGVQVGRTALYYRIDKWSLRHYDAVVCVSDDLYAECRRVGVRKERCHLIENAIDIDEFRRGTASPNGGCTCDTDHSLPDRPTGVLVGALGRLSAEKGFDLLIRALAALVGDGLGISLWIGGEGDQRGELQRLIDELGLQQRVRLLGHVDDPKAFQESLDVFALSSVREGLPNVVLEAMAMQVPVVATRVAGIPSLIRDGENGLLVDAGSAEQLATAIRRLADDRDLRSRLAESARATIEQSYSFQRRMEKMVRVYEGVGVRA